MTFPIPSTVNQLYQTTAAKGNPTVDGGAAFNTNEMVSNLGCSCIGCLYTFFCLPCTVGDLVNKAYGMPWCMGCCCMNLFTARNTIRYHYRLKTTSGGNECIEECALPYGVYCLLSILSGYVPCLWPITYCNCVALVLLSMNIQEEVKTKTTSGLGGKGYMVGYSPSVGPMPVHVAVVEPQGVVYAKAVPEGV